MRIRNNVIEYRIYELSPDKPFFCLCGDDWRISDVLSERLHFHNCLEIGFCLSDSGFLGFEAGETVPFQAGDIFLIPRFVPHTTCSSKGHRSLWSYLFIDLDAIVQGYGARYSEHLPGLGSLIGQHLRITAASHPRLHFLCNCLLEEVRDRAQNDATLFTLYCLALGAELRLLLGAAAKASPVRDRSFVLKPALEYVNDHYMEACNIGLLSNLCHLSQTHFRRLFLSIMGISPLQYVIRMRIRQACILLNTTNEPITSIAHAVGISSISSFNRNFQQIMGTGPQQYRNMASKPASRPRQHILPYKGWLVPENL